MSTRPNVPTTSSVRSQDWSGRDLTGERYEQVELVDVDLTETINRGSIFDGCRFVGVAFNASRHQDAAFTNCAFIRCTFFEASFRDCKMVGSSFERSTYPIMRVTGGDWSFVALSFADLRGASFEHVRMREADLESVHLEGAVLVRCDLSGASFHGAHLDRCDLRGSDLSSVDPRTVELAEAIIGLDQAVTIATSLGLDVRADEDDADRSRWT